MLFMTINQPQVMIIGNINFAVPHPLSYESLFYLLTQLRINLEAGSYVCLCHRAANRI